MLEVDTNIGNHNLDRSDKFMPLMGSEDPPSPQTVAYTDVNIVPEHDNQGFELMISKLQALREKQRSLDGKRGEELNKILDIKGSIRVFCRVRPSPPTNNRKIVVQPISTEPEKITVRFAGTRKEFNFDRVFPHEATQDDVFLEVEPIIGSALDGHNVCIFAYGQTSTGKTFTMEGTNEQPGIVPRALEQLFRRASLEKSTSLTFSLSMLEVYMGNVRDLLASKQHSTCHMGSGPKCSLSILSSSNGSVKIEGLTDVAIHDLKQANRFYARGKRSRSTSWTNVNEASSRSHCLTRISIGRSGDIGETSAASKLWLVDLGGSERLLKTGATGQTLDEGKAINLSLSALGDVIAALKRKHNHIPYRNSKLTQILRDSLGDGSKALMLVHVSLSQNDVAESICSLTFAKRVRDIEPNKELSEDSKKQKEKCIKEIENKISDYEEQLQEVKNQIEKLETLVEENKKLLSYGYQLHEDQKGSTRSFLSVESQDVKESPRTADKSMYKAHPCSVPRFMTSTVCSRQRKGAAAEVVNSRLRTFRLQNSGSVDFTGSQSLGYFDPNLKTNLQVSKSKLVSCETNTSKQTREVSRLRSQQDPSCNSTDLKSCSFSKNRRISTPQPNFRVPMHQHRRRMSALT